MIIKENLIIGERDFIKTYSDIGMMVERDGERYAEAIDPAEYGREYVETNEPVEAVEEVTGDEISAEEFYNMVEGVL